MTIGNTQVRVIADRDASTMLTIFTDTRDQVVFVAGYRAHPHAGTQEPTATQVGNLCSNNTFSFVSDDSGDGSDFADYLIHRFWPTLNQEAQRRLHSFCCRIIHAAHDEEMACEYRCIINHFFA